MSKSQRYARRQNAPLTVGRFADAAKVNALTVRNWIEAGKIKAKRISCVAVRAGFFYEIPHSELAKAESLRANGRKYEHRHH